MISIVRSQCFLQDSSLVGKFVSKLQLPGASLTILYLKLIKSTGEIKQEVS